MDAVFIPTAERRKQVKLRTRSDLQISIQQYEGRYCQVVKDPVSLKYYRFNQHEFYIFSRLNGKNSLEDIRLQFEKEFAPDTLQLEEMEGFARQLVSAGLVQHDTPNAAKELFAKRGKQRNLKRIATWTNVLYIKLPVFDPDRLLTWMLKYTRWIFTRTFLWLSISLMLAAALFVGFHYKTFYAKMPAYHEFFAFRTLLYMWLALGIVKVIHEFGHGLSCKAFGGESHEMGALSVFMAGGGIKGGVVHGQTDEIGFHAVENRHYVTDVHATIMHQLGLDTRKLELPGRKRLDIDHGEVIKEIVG
jgi:putative peptide zinc metalloprotease protein